MNISASDVMSLCALILTCVVAIIGVVLTGEQVKKNRHTDYNERAQIDNYRKYFEDRIYKLQEELAANERRWSDVNHLIINGQRSIKPFGNDEANSYPPTTFFENLGIDVNKVYVDHKSVFVLTPFSDDGTKTFNIIKNICGEVDIKCSRGDEVNRQGNILSHIVLSILQSNIIIANINGRNPNVFYELGICHTLGKPVIIISNIKDNPPFDINAKNIIFYKDSNDLQFQLRSELLKIYIDSVKRED